MDRQPNAATADAQATWQPIRRRRAFEEVFDQIERQILDGSLRPGDRLPSERDLAERLGVSRQSMREAFRVLEALEVITVKPASGPSSRATLTSAPGDALASLLRLHVTLNDIAGDDLLELRILLESWAARQAATRATADQILALREILRRTEAPLPPERQSAVGHEFHQAIAEAASNPLVVWFLRGVQQTIQRQMIVMAGEAGDWPELARTIHDEHRAILDAIERGDGEAAASLLESHIRSFYEGAEVVSGGTG